MNDLSLALYWADALGSLDAVAISAFVLMSFISAMAAAATLLIYDDDEKSTVVKFVQRCILTLPIIGIMIVVTPSKETVYAIAASEMTEQALKMPVANKAMQAVEKWIDKQLSGNLSASQGDDGK